MFREQTVYVLTDEYEEVVAYDAGNSNEITTGATTKVANRFHKSGALRAIGTYTRGRDQEITVEVLDGEFGEVLFATTEKYDFPGYHLIPLEEELSVNDYTIVITYKGAAPVEGESWSDLFCNYVVTSHEGESYVWVDDTWMDLSKTETKEKLNIDFIPNNACIKAIY